ncbi:hypothetical protein KI387_000214, partial [Taxus chinensis]
DEAWDGSIKRTVRIAAAILNDNMVDEVFVTPNITQTVSPSNPEMVPQVATQATPSVTPRRSS